MFRLLLPLLPVVALVILVRHSWLAQLFEGQALHRVFTHLASRAEAPPLFVFALSTGLTFGFPATPFILVGGIAFGIVHGTLYTWLGMVIGAVQAFLASRYFIRELVTQWYGGRVAELDAQLSQNGLRAVFTLRMIPVMPYNLINYLAGLTRIDFSSYLIGTALGIFPSTLLITWFAHSLWSGTGTVATYLSLLGGALAMIAVATLPWYRQRRHSSRSER